VGDAASERRKVMNPEDKRPTGLSVQERYRRIRTWYQANVSKYAAEPGNLGENAKLSEPYIRDLPPPESASPTQIEAVFNDVKRGRLEWAYTQSDGKYTMAEYAGA
jgi:hypothetical protein